MHVINTIKPDNVSIPIDENTHEKRTASATSLPETLAVTEAVILQQLEKEGITGIVRVKQHPTFKTARSISWYDPTTEINPTFYTKLHLEKIDSVKINEYHFNSTKEVTERFIDVANILQRIYEKGYMHHDIKPNNILIEDSTNQTIIADFGCATKHTGGHSYTAGLTHMYGAPEVRFATTKVEKNGSLYREANIESDIYSLSMSLIKVLRIKTALIRANTNETETDQILEQIVNNIKEAIQNKTIPEAVGKILIQNIAKDPSKRMHSFAEFAEALKKIDW